MEMALWSLMKQWKKAFELLKGQCLWKQMLACPTQHKEQFCRQRESSYCWIFIGSLIICYKAAKHGIPNSMNSIMNGLFIFLISLY